jgi:predicted nucleic acid-binding protein
VETVDRISLACLKSSFIRARGQGHAPGLVDIIIAATAQRHALTILSATLGLSSLWA